VLQQMPKKGPSFRVVESRMTTLNLVCMAKINHWGVGVTKLRDDIVGNQRNLYIAEKYILIGYISVADNMGLSSFV